MRLDEVSAAYGDRIRVHWRAFPLIPDRQPGRRVTARTREGRRRAGAEEPRARFVPPELDSALPASSVPALTAAKCAERQGPVAFDRLHRRLLDGHFGDNLDIGRQDVLWDLARECGLDMACFERDYAGGEAYREVLHDCAEAVGWFGVSALPTVIFAEKLSLVGAVPADRYRAIIDWILAGEPGGVIPLAPASADAPAAGRSAVGERDPAR